MAQYKQLDLRLALLVQIILFTLGGSTSADLHNVTIDDAYSGGIEGVAISYLPSNDWAEGQNCKGCAAQPDVSQVFDGTWHDATSFHGDNLQRSIGLNFTGIAVYVYFILSDNFATSFSSLTNLTFSMDGKESGNFIHNTSVDNPFKYNVRVYSKTDLKNTSHFLNMSTTGSAHSLMLFDYFNYTIDGDLSDGKSVIDVQTSTSISSSPSTKVNDSPTALVTPSPSPGSTSNLTGPIGKDPISNVVVGVLVGAIVVVIVMVVFILFLSVRRREMPYLLPCLPRHQRKEPRIQAGHRETVQRSSLETLPRYMHKVDDALTARPVLGEKGYLIRRDDIQGRIEALRTELGRYHDLSEYSLSHSELSSITSIRPSENASQHRDPENTTVPQILTQITTLRAQIHHWEEKLAAIT